jgi:O-Antigen ligase
MKEEGIIKKALYLIEVFIFFSFILIFRDLPFFGSKIQFSELIFIPLFIVFLFVIIKKYRSYQVLLIDKVLMIFSLSISIICVINGFANTYLEIIGVFYFLAIYAVFNLFYLEINLNRVKNIIYLIVLIASITGIIGFVLTNLGIDTYLAWSKNSPYPYFSQLGRARGLSGHPNNLMSITIIGWVFMILDVFNNQFKLNVKNILFFLITGIGAILTFSKMGILFIIGMILVLKYWYRSPKRNKMFNFLIGLNIFIYVFLTHFGIYNPNSQNYKVLLESGLVSNTLVYQINDSHGLYANNYYLTKKAAILFGLENQPFGIGMGEFVKSYQTFKDKNIYTIYMDAFEPHSLYTGFWVENGIVGLVCLLCVFIFLMFYFKENSNLSNTNDAILLKGCLIILCLYLIDGIVTDVFFLRYYFLIFVLATIITRKHILERKPKITQETIKNSIYN